MNPSISNSQIHIKSFIFPRITSKKHANLNTQFSPKPKKHGLIPTPPEIPTKHAFRFELETSAYVQNCKSEYRNLTFNFREFSYKRKSEKSTLREDETDAEKDCDHQNDEPWPAEDVWELASHDYEDLERTSMTLAE
ncbi:hypothetical protein L596_008838 [Steinernema carpocapsae]|uniref:Uncharacterized protein n=1 Tax=Steinernema carpocapsae TaxID=34508 RepID=A0A4U5PE62_STECR|nr:hypothetical protein L596_008838 [Steinernema carpocapsae]